MEHGRDWVKTEKTEKRNEIMNLKKINRHIKLIEKKIRGNTPKPGPLPRVLCSGLLPAAIDQRCPTSKLP